MVDSAQHGGVGAEIAIKAETTVVQLYNSDNTSIDRYGIERHLLFTYKCYLSFIIILDIHIIKDLKLIYNPEMSFEKSLRYDFHI